MQGVPIGLRKSGTDRNWTSLPGVEPPTRRWRLPATRSLSPFPITQIRAVQIAHLDQTVVTGDFTLFILTSDWTIMLGSGHKQSPRSHGRPPLNRPSDWRISHRSRLSRRRLQESA